MAQVRKQPVAFVDDEEDLARSLAAKFSNEYETFPFTSARDALNRIDDSFAVVIADYRMPGMTGVDLLAKLRTKSPNTIRVLLTAFADLIPLQALINEAQISHYIPKDPLSLLYLKTVLADAVELYSRRQERERGFACLEQKNTQLEALVRMQSSDERSFDDLLGDDPQLLAAIKKARFAANSDLTVLITGESGTGKEELARAIHFQGKRKGKPFKKTNCSMFQKELLQGELFGTVEGAYTGAKDAHGILRAADGGTVFLDEIGEMVPEVQAYLLAFLDGGDIHPVGYSGVKNLKGNVRIVTATNKDLRSEVEDKLFRLDLFSRINQIPIHLPALRDRRADIPLLTRRAALLASRKLGLDNVSIGASVIGHLQTLPYGGNVRELFNIVLHAMLFMQMDGAKTVDLDYVRAATEMEGTGPAVGSCRLDEAVEVFKRQYVETVVRRHRTQRAAAEELGVEVRTLFNLMKRYGLSKEE